MAQATDYSRRLVVFHVHLISDATGETLDLMARASASQFSNVRPVFHVSPLIRSHTQLDDALKLVEAVPGVVLYTLTSAEYHERVQLRCHELQIPALSALDPMMNLFSEFLGIARRNKPAAQHRLDENYYQRISALDFTIAHDDGNQLWDIDEADVILFGVSRTSKTPTCMYLANRGIKAANMPIIADMQMDEAIFRLKKPLKVGLTVTPQRLLELRQSRLTNLFRKSENVLTPYVDLHDVRNELRKARRIYSQHGLHVIDVTKKSVEETAASIISMLRKK